MNYKQEYDRFCDEINELSKQIFGEYYPENLYENPVRLDNRDQKVILILGINPAGNQQDHPGFLQHVPDQELLQYYSSHGSHEKSLFYRRYFEENYKLVEDLKPKMWWSSYEEKTKEVEVYCSKIFNDESKKQTLLKKMQEEANKKGPYLAFGDLFYVHETNSETIKKIVSQKDDLINKSINLILNYYRPNMVIITNSFVSNKFIAKFKQNKDITSFIENNIVFVLSGFVSSGRLDTFNKLRHTNEITTLYKKHLG